jgi:hypothetical protein
MFDVLKVGYESASDAGNLMDNDDGGRKAEDAEAEDVEEGLNGG